MRRHSGDQAIRATALDPLKHTPSFIMSWGIWALLLTGSVRPSDAAALASLEATSSQPTYQLATRGFCVEHVKSLAECTAAAAALRLSGRTTRGTATPLAAVEDDVSAPDSEDPEHVPPGCYLVAPTGPTSREFSVGADDHPSESVLKFNARGTNQGGCSIFNACVCRGKPADQEEDAQEAKAAAHELASAEAEEDDLKDGEADASAAEPFEAGAPKADDAAPSMTSAAGAEEKPAVEDYGREDLTPSAADPAAKEWHPPMPWEGDVESSVGGKREDADEALGSAGHDRQLSHSYSSPPPPTHSSGYYIQTSGRCANHITTKSGCEAAATALYGSTYGIYDKTAYGNYWRYSFYPKYCYYYRYGYLYFNYYGYNYGYCSTTYKCLCAPQTPKPPPPPPPSPSPPPPHDMDLYEIRTSGRCAAQITSRTTCLRAAQVMYGYTTGYVYRAQSIKCTNERDFILLPLLPYFSWDDALCRPATLDATCDAFLCPCSTCVL